MLQNIIHILQKRKRLSNDPARVTGVPIHMFLRTHFRPVKTFPYAQLPVTGTSFAKAYAP